MVVVLPEPLTPTTRITNGFLAVSISSGRATGASVRSTSSASRRLTSSGSMPFVAPLADRLAHARRRADAEIGLQQNVFEIVERGRVELALGEDVDDAAPDRRGRARQARSDSRDSQPRLGFRRGGGRGRRRRRAAPRNQRPMRSAWAAGGGAPDGSRRRGHITPAPSSRSPPGADSAATGGAGLASAALFAALGSRGAAGAQGRQRAGWSRPAEQPPKQPVFRLVF